MRRSSLRRRAVLAVVLSAACNAPLVLAELPGEAGVVDASPPSLGEQADTGADEDAFTSIQNGFDGAPVEDADPPSDAMDGADIAFD